MVSALAAGFGLGFLVAAQVGPIWLLCVRSVLRGRLATGLAIGLGAAIVDVAYASLGVAGAAGLLALGSLRLALGLAGACLLAVLGARTLLRGMGRSARSDAGAAAVAPARALRTALLATAANPLTIASWAAIFAAASAARVARGTLATAAMLAGVGCGTLSWFTILSGAVALLRVRLGERWLRLADVAAGAGLVGFGGLLGLRALHG